MKIQMHTLVGWLIGRRCRETAWFERKVTLSGTSRNNSTPSIQHASLQSTT